MNLTVKAASTFLLLAMASTASPQSEPLGRLFFTPDQRAVLDRQRQRNPNSALVSNESARLTLNGRVIRSSGRNTEWINGTPFNEQDARTLTPMRLQPGETTAGSVEGKPTDVLNGGTIRINRHTDSSSR